MTEFDVSYSSNNYSVLDLIHDEVSKVKKNLPKSYDGVAQFLAIMRPLIELNLMNCRDWTDHFEPTGPVRPPISHTSLMLILILAKMQRVSYRQIERMINAHRNWLRCTTVRKMYFPCMIKYLSKGERSLLFSNVF